MKYLFNKKDKKVIFLIDYLFDYGRLTETINFQY